MSASTPNVQRGFRSQGLGMALATTALAVAIGGGLLIGQAVTRSNTAPAAPNSVQAQNYNNAYHAYLAGGSTVAVPVRDQGWSVDNATVNMDPALDQAWSVRTTAPATTGSFDRGYEIETAPAGEHGTGGANGTRLPR